MSKSQTQIFDEKVSLIYQYDRTSPIFVRMADNEINRNNVEKAIEILTSGLKDYPNYATAYFILGKAYSLLGNYVQALKAYKTGSNLIYSNRTFEFYLKEIENLKKERSPFDKRNVSIFLETENDETVEPELFGSSEETFDESNLEGTEKSDITKPEGSFAHLKLQKDEPENIGDEKVSNTFSDHPLIVSETLAKIYITQGELKEAISVYEKLKKKNPEKAQYYSEKIAELLNNLK